MYGYAVGLPNVKNETKQTKNNSGEKIEKKKK